MTRVGGRSGGRTVLGMIAALALAAGAAACTGDDADDAAGEDTSDVVGTGDTYQATIRRTSAGVPHISADSSADLAFGQGWASGEDRACDLADQVVKIRGERARWFGAGEDDANVDSDLAWKAIGIFDRASDDWSDASDGVIELITAFTAGWNAQLDEVGADGLEGWCAGEEWVRPLEPVEVYAYARSIALQASSGAIVDFIASAQPPESPAETTTSSPDEAASAPLVPAAQDIGSNGWAIGAERSADGGGMLVANPHFPWEGELRFWEVHLTVPGELDVVRRAALGAARHRHRLHRELRLDPHGLRRQPLHRVHARARARLAHHLRVRRRPAGDDVAGRDRGGARRGRPGQRRRPGPCGRATTGRSSTSPASAGPRPPPSPTATPTSTTTSSSSSTSACCRPTTSTSSSRSTERSTASRCSTPSPCPTTGGPGTPTRRPPPTCPTRRSPPTEASLESDPIVQIAADNGAVLLDGSDPRLRVGRRGRRPRPGPGALRRAAHGRAGRLRVQRQRLVLAAARHRDARRRLLTAPRRPADGPVAPHPGERRGAGGHDDGRAVRRGRCVHPRRAGGGHRAEPGLHLARPAGVGGGALPRGLDGRRAGPGAAERRRRRWPGTVAGRQGRRGPGVCGPGRVGRRVRRRPGRAAVVARAVGQRRALPT